MIDAAYLREFAYLQDAAYLDVASVGLQPERTLAYCRQFQDEFVKTFGRICFGPYGERRDAVRRNIARLIGAADAAGEIVFARNTTEGNSLLASSYPLASGDSVISSASEYPSVVLGWAQRQADGVRLELVPPHNGVLDADEIIARMDETTKVVALSFVQYRSGFKADLAKIGKECRKRGILLHVDGIQGIGRNPIDVQKMNIDVLSCGGFKGLMGPFGVGFVYVRKALLSQLRPYGFNEDNVEVDEDALPVMRTLPVFPYREGAQRLEAGSMNTYGITALGKSVELLLEIGIEHIHAHVMELERQLRRELAGLPVTLRGAEAEQYWSGNVCMNFAPDKTSRVEAAFEKYKVYGRLDTGFLRLSFHYYNTPEHVQRAARALREALL